MTTKRIWAALALLTTATLGVTACAAGAGDTDETTSAGTGAFTYVIASDPSSLNPINVGDRWGLTVTNLIYSPLARVEGDGTVRNELAESIEPAEDGLSVTVTLKDGLEWSDGEPLTAEDVVFTYTQKAVKENGNADLLWIGDQPITATAEDDQTVVFHLPSVSAAALSNIATETYIIPEHVYGEVTDFSGAELDPIAVGSGPYVLKDYERGQYLTFAPNPNYYGEPANIADLTLQIVGNADTVKTALQTGEADASFVTADQIDQLAASGLDIYPYAEGRVAYLGLNAAKITDQKVRQAIFFALNRDDLNTAAFLSDDYYENAYTILPPSNSFATDDVQKYEQDAAAATDLLTEAGATGFTFTLAYAGADPTQTTQATLIQEQLKAVGITVELAAVEPAAVYTEIEKGADSQYDAFLGGYIMGQDPDAYSLLYASGASANYFQYANPATDALFEAGKVELDPTARAAIYADLQAQIADDAVVFPLADNKKILAVNPRIGGVEEAGLVPIYTLENFGLLTEK